MKKFVGGLKSIGKVNFLWDWWDFGVMLTVYKNGIGNPYLFSIDTQIGWFNLWVECIKLKNK